MEQRLRRAILTLILLVYGCSAYPTTPAPAPPLAAGTYMLSIMAPDAVFVNDQLASACPGAAADAASAVIAVATVSADRDVSRVRPVSAAEGTFEMELVRDRGNPASTTSISGSVRGMAINTRYAATSDGHPADARATFSGTAPGSAAQLEGVVHANSAIAEGKISGHVVMGDSHGSEVSCTTGTVLWSLSRMS